MRNYIIHLLTDLDFSSLGLEVFAYPNLVIYSCQEICHKDLLLNNAQQQLSMNLLEFPSNNLGDTACRSCAKLDCGAHSFKWR